MGKSKECKSKTAVHGAYYREASFYGFINLMYVCVCVHIYVYIFFFGGAVTKLGLRPPSFEVFRSHGIRHTHTHTTHTNTQTQTHTHTNTHTQTHTPHTQPHTPHTQTQTHKHKHTHTQTHTHKYTRKHTLCRLQPATRIPLQPNHTETPIHIEPRTIRPMW